MPQTGPSLTDTAVGDAGIVEPVIERLLSLQRADGGWPYEPGQQTSFTEPTCWTLLALHAAGRLDDAVSGRGAAFLRSVQLPEGGFHSGAIDAEANWSSTLAVWCLAALQRERECVEKGVHWLIGFEGNHWEKKPESFFAHDTALRGWPWLAGCHSWIEPTCYALFALTAAGRVDHARLHEARRMILDRALPSGGWNYGNTRVLGTELRAFPSTTAVALIALRQHGQCPQVDGGVRFLMQAFPRLRTAWALGWSALAARYCGLGAWRSGDTSDPGRQVTVCLDGLLKPTTRFRVHEAAVLSMAACDGQQLPFPTAAETGAAVAAAAGQQ